MVYFIIILISIININLSLKLNVNKNNDGKVNRKNYLISLLGKKAANNLNINKLGLNYKKNNNKKEIILTQFNH